MIGTSALPKLTRFFSGLVLLCAAAGPVGAHPQAWITTTAAVVFNAKGEVSAVSVDWTFDKNYSSYAIEGLDTDGDGQFSPSELMVLADENIKALREYDYFVYPRGGKQKLEWGMVSDYGISRNDDDRLEMQFVIPLVTPVDPRRVPFSFKIYDPTFYIDIEYPDKNPLEVIGQLPAGCKLALMPSPSDEQTKATKSMLAAKPQDWQPDPGEDFGSMFAQPVRLDCAKAGS